MSMSIDDKVQQGSEKEIDEQLAKAPAVLYIKKRGLGTFYFYNKSKEVCEKYLNEHDKKLVGKIAILNEIIFNINIPLTMIKHFEEYNSLEDSIGKIRTLYGLKETDLEEVKKSIAPIEVGQISREQYPKIVDTINDYIKRLI